MPAAVAGRDGAGAALDLGHGRTVVYVDVAEVVVSSGLDGTDVDGHDSYIDGRCGVVLNRCANCSAAAR